MPTGDNHGRCRDNLKRAVKWKNIKQLEKLSLGYIQTSEPEMVSLVLILQGCYSLPNDRSESSIKGWDMGHQANWSPRPRSRWDSVRLLGWPDSYTLLTQGKVPNDVQAIHQSFYQGKDVCKQHSCYGTNSFRAKCGQEALESATSLGRDFWLGCFKCSLTTLGIYPSS